MVELICAVAANGYIEQCIYTLNVFKVKHKDSRATFFVISLVFLLLHLNILFAWIWFSVASRRKLG